MNKMKKCVWLIALMFASTGLRAQDTLRLDLPQALEIALSENPTIKIADKEIQRQEYVRKETRGNLYPNLSGSGTYNYAIKKSTMDFGGQKVSLEPTNTVVAAASLNLPLFIPSVYQTLKMNDEQMRAAVEEARASKITLVAEVKKAFYNVLLAQRSHEVLKASEENITQVVNQTQALFDQEMASEYDLLTAQVQLSNLEPTIIQTENSIRVAKDLLKMYLFLPQELEITLTGNLVELFKQNGLEGAGASMDLSGNSDLRQLDIQQDILRQQFKVLRTNRYPTLAFVGSAQYMGRNNISFGGDTGGKSWQNLAPMAIGLQASVPIFAGWTNVNREKQLRSNIEQVQLQRDYLAESVNVQAKTARNDIMTAQAKMAANQKAITQAQRGYEIARARYYADMGTILELNSAQLSLTQARLSLSQSSYDYLAAQAEYERILGNKF